MLTMERAKELNDAMVTEPHLRVHALSVSAAMRAMAAYFGEDAEHWAAIGYLPITIMNATPRSTSSIPRSRSRKRALLRRRSAPSSATAMACARTWNR